MNYEKLAVPADVCVPALEEAARRVGPAFLYILHVNGYQFWNCKRLLQKIAADSADNPFTPYVNLVEDGALSNWEWFLTANGKACGSQGVN